MARKIIAGTYTFVDAPEKLTQFTSATNILFDDSNGTVINYTTSPLSGITTNKFVLAVDRPNETQRYLVYAFEDTTAAGGALSVSKGWYWFNESSTSLDAIPAPSVVFSDNCSINDELTTTQANALFTTSPIQVQPTVTTTRVLYKGKKELTMAQFEALASLDDAIDYDITDFPNGGITNAQMTAALGYSRLFEDGEIYVCSDNGTYTKGHTYQVKVTGGVKSWEDITPASGDLQNYVPKQSEAEPVALTWRFNDTVDTNRDNDFLVNFTSNGINFTEMGFKWSLQQSPAPKDTMYYSSPTKFQDVYYGQWGVDNEYRTVTFETAPSGELLAWLQANAVPQSEVDPNTALTWTINNPWGSNDEFSNFGYVSINFTSDGKKFIQFCGEGDIGYTLEGQSQHMWIYKNWTSNSGYAPLGISTGDDLSMYRTVTFATAPTGTLLEWLKTHAVPQGSSTKTYAQITNENGAVAIRVFENSDADLQNLSVTKNGVTINGKKPLTSVQPLYKHELVIPYSFSVGDSETVNGSVMYHYLSNTGTQITSASEIDDNFLLSGAIGKNSGSDALTWVINEKPSVPDKMFSVKFTSNNIRYNNIALSSTGDALPGIPNVLIAYHQEESGMFDQVYEIYQGTERWGSQAYRTVTFETAPSGDLLTWLQANAVPQGGADSNTVLLLNINVTKAGSSITVEAVNASTMGYITGTVGTITDTVTQLI